jgi:NADH-quinone oxidoreductase subunit M
MLLAGIILKITTYVLIRLSALVFFQWLFVPFEIFFLTLALSTAVFGALGALSTTDLKKLAAYSSVSHMGIILVSGFLLGASSFSLQPYLILLMTHTFISTAMFMIIGCIYKNRTSSFISRNRLSYSGLLYAYPFLFLFGLILFANLNIPLTLGFIGELGVFASSAQLGSSTILFLLLGSFILLLPILMVIAQVLMGPFRGFDYVFNQLISSSEFNGIRLYNQTRVFDHLSFSKHYIMAYSRLKSFFGSISCSIIGFGLLPIIFARFCNNYVVFYPTFVFLN